MNKNLTKDIGLLRLNDLNNKIKHLDRKMDILIENVKYTNIKLFEIHDELFNNNVPSPNIKRNLSLSRTPDNDKYKRNSEYNYYETSYSPLNSSDKTKYHGKYDDNNSSSDENSPRYLSPQILPTKADKTYLGVPTTYKPTNIFLPKIDKNKNKNKKSKMISRRSIDSLNTLNSLK